MFSGYRAPLGASLVEILPGSFGLIRCYSQILTTISIFNESQFWISDILLIIALRIVDGPARVRLVTSRAG